MTTDIDTPASGRKTSNPSGISLPADGHLPGVHDHRNLPFAAGMLQHLRQILIRCLHVDILEIDTPFLVGFPSLLGMRSSIFTENQHLFTHRSPS